MELQLQWRPPPLQRPPCVCLAWMGMRRLLATPLAPVHLQRRPAALQATVLPRRLLLQPMLVLLPLRQLQPPPPWLQATPRLRRWRRHAKLSRELEPPLRP